MNKKLLISIFGAIILIGVAVTVVKGATFLPLVTNESNITSAAPTHVLYVFSTIATINGNAGGRTGMNAICSNEDVASHFCTRNEIEDSMRTSGVFFKPPFLKAWVDYLDFNTSISSYGITSQYVLWDFRTCGGWKETNNVNGGTFIGDDAVLISTTSDCSIPIRVSCCKWIP